MAQVSMCRAAVVAFFVVAIISAVSAQESDREMAPAPAPAPSMVTGSAFAVPISGVVPCSSLFFSLLMLLKQR
uniref:Arabinogalactan peptide 13-like n=1 Tax=Nelumbo nucifera TaxID=4432 RepID=A0A822ZKP8_NELNU|nr:TPA_asm: hypothetical protein HUJ06_000558 [Nelumbo nucifera]